MRYNPVAATFARFSGAPSCPWKRFSELLTWSEVTHTAADWWESSGPGHFLAIQVYPALLGEPLYVLCLAVDGQTSFHAVFCDPDQCPQSRCVAVGYVERLDDEVVTGSARSHCTCPMVSALDALDLLIIEQGAQPGVQHSMICARADVDAVTRATAQSAHPTQKSVVAM